MKELPALQKAEANSAFARFIRKSYPQWMRQGANPPLMSPALFKKTVFPAIERGEKLFFILIDNFRLDQWYAVKSLFTDLFICDEELYFSILPTATPYARNSIFSGLMPRQLATQFPDYWVDDHEEEGKNLQEELLIQAQLERKHLSHLSTRRSIPSWRPQNQLKIYELEKERSPVWVLTSSICFSFREQFDNVRGSLTMNRHTFHTHQSCFLLSPLHDFAEKKIAPKDTGSDDHRYGLRRVTNGMKYWLSE